MLTIVGGIRRIKGGVFLSAKIGRIQEKNAECGKRNIASLTSRAHDKEEVTRIYTS